MNYKVIGVIAIVAVILFFVIKKKKDPMASKNSVKDIAKDVNAGNINSTNLGQQNILEQVTGALNDIIKEFGVDTARKVEQIYRLETNHFKSGGFLNGFSPGMEKHKETFPFGWSSMKDFWNEINFVPGIHKMKENLAGKKGAGPVKEFLKFPNVNIPMRGLALYIQKYSPERWYSIKPDKQAEYRNKLAGIKPKIVDQLWKG